MINYRTDSSHTGPLFSGQTSRLIALAIDAAEEEIATMSATHLQGDLGAPPFKNPTGWYRSHITPKRLGIAWVVQDSGVVYGPWLAGTSSRNRTSRFKGYQHWRRAIAYTHRIGRTVVLRFIGRAVERG